MEVHKSAAGKIRRPRRRRNSPVTAEKVNPAAWASALALAGSDAGRLRVINATTVIVVNRANHSGAGRG